MGLETNLNSVPRLHLHGSVPKKVRFCVTKVTVDHLGARIFLLTLTRVRLRIRVSPAFHQYLPHDHAIESVLESSESVSPN